MPEDHPALSSEDRLALARLALAEGNLSQAAEHVAAALAQAPTLPEVHETLARVDAASGGDLELFPLGRHAFVGAVVARAHLLAASGRPAEGLDLLAAATAYAPGERWGAVPWVTAPELPERLDPERLARILMQVCAAVPDPAPRRLRDPLGPYLTLAHNAVRVHPAHPLLLGAASALARRLGEVPLAVTWASRGVRAQPSKLGEVWLGYAYRSAGRTREALAALGRAAAIDPEDLSVYADIAGTLADNGRLDEALEWIDRALAKDPTFDCTVHTAHRLRFQRDGDVAHLVALADFTRDHPDDSHEHGDLAECCRSRPWLGQVTPASGPVLDALRQALAAEGGTRLAVRLDALEPPSAMRTAAAAAPGLEVEVVTVAHPDPREPRRATDCQLWRYEGTTAAPTLPRPSGEAAERIRHLVHPAWPHPPAAYDSAVGLATVDLPDLLGLLVYPPEAPPTALGRMLAGPDPSLWVRCVQVWACLGLLHHRTDEPWADSTRRRVLLELVWGVEDWVTEAALFALVTAAWVDPAVRPDVAAVVAERLADVAAVARVRRMPIAASLAHLALATPDLDRTTRELAHELIDAAARGPRRPGPLARLRQRVAALLRRFG